jgi:glycosyltransferase involved in cell wall biosynthesis
METLAHETFRALEHIGGAPDLIALGRSQANLTWFIPYAAARLIRLLPRKRSIDVLCGDGLIYVALHPILRRFPRVCVVVHGKDLTFPPAPYQRLIRRDLRHAAVVLANSHATASEARRLGVDPERIKVLRLGFDVPAVSEDEHERTRRQLCRRMGVAEGSFIMLTLGRLIRRKGVAWFIENVIPRLPRDAVYLVAGSGPAGEKIRSAWSDAGRPDTVRILGSVDDATRELLLVGSDVFVMPNVPVPGDMEGFGLVAIEATHRGTPVIASDLEGIRDAVVDGVTGYACAALDAAAFVDRIVQCMNDRAGLRRAAREFERAARNRFSRDAMTADLAAALRLLGAAP